MHIFILSDVFQVSEMTKEDLLKDYKAVINAISYLFSGHLELTVNGQL